MEALSQVSGGDMRKTITTLQVGWGVGAVLPGQQARQQWASCAGRAGLG